MSSLKEQKLYWQNEIIAKLERKWILWFLIEEIKDSLEYLNAYKVKNVYENVDLLLADLSAIQTTYLKELRK